MLFTCFLNLNKWNVSNLEWILLKLIMLAKVTAYVYCAVSVLHFNSGISIYIIPGVSKKYPLLTGNRNKTIRYYYFLSGMLWSCAVHHHHHYISLLGTFVPLKSNCHPEFFASLYFSIRYICTFKEPLSPRILRAPWGGKHNTTQHNLLAERGRSGKEQRRTFIAGKGNENDGKERKWNIHISSKVSLKFLSSICFIDQDKCVCFLFCLLHCIAPINADSHALTHCSISVLAIVHIE